MKELIQEVKAAGDVNPTMTPRFVGQATTTPPRSRATPGCRSIAATCRRSSLAALPFNASLPHCSSTASLNCTPTSSVASMRSTTRRRVPPRSATTSPFHFCLDELEKADSANARRSAPMPTGCASCAVEPDSDGREGAILKGWVESRFGLLPRFHGEPLRDFGRRIPPLSGDALGRALRHQRARRPARSRVCLQSA